MPSLAEWLKLGHVLVAFWFVTGLVGRNVVLRQAERSSDLAAVTNSVSAAGRFEALMVRPGSGLVLVAGLLTMWAQHIPFFEHGTYWLATSLAIFLASFALVPTVFLPRGRIFEAALEDARRKNAVTPELSAAFRDPAVAAARLTETVGGVVIVALMVLKPF